MPPYATLAQLRARASGRNLAQAAAPDDASVTRDLLDLTIDNGDRSAYTADERAAADAAVAALQLALQDATDEIDSWIAPRFPDVAATPPPVLVAHCADLALYRLYQPGHPDDPIAQRHKGVMAWLKEVARGGIDLSAPAPDPDMSAGVMYDAPPRVFTRDTLAGY